MYDPECMLSGYKDGMDSTAITFFGSTNGAQLSFLAWCLLGLGTERYSQIMLCLALHLGLLHAKLVSQAFKLTHWPNSFVSEKQGKACVDSWLHFIQSKIAFKI